MAPAPSSSSTSGSPARPYRSRFGDTTLTKVFVGGLTWQTTSEGLRRHFERYGDILEAIVIMDRLTGRSKGYGFVTFREAEAALRAVQDPNPTIAGRRANCNIASLGTPRPRGMMATFVGIGPSLQVQARPFFPAAPTMAAQQLQFGYWYPPDFQYQQALANPQVLQNYYAQMYGLTSPVPAPPPFHQYVGSYMPSPAATPRAVLPPALALALAPQVAAAQALVHHPLPPLPPPQQIPGPFLPMPSLPQNFRLQLPSRPAAVPIMLPPPSTTAADHAATSAQATDASSAPAGA